ncbi:MAG: hypothetical protein JWM87_117 [Candidatus Eremiobacteraeota bacterium]|nr:hypothetical protein [Candidatus Eremiobacteraeota bacterium]
MASSDGRWRPTIADIEFTPESERLIELRPLVELIVAAVGSDAIARLLGADRADVSCWTSGGAISAEMGRRVLELHAVFARLLRLFARDVAARWLVGSEPLLGGARPIDVLALHGSAGVVRALDGIAQGAYS